MFVRGYNIQVHVQVLKPRLSCHVTTTCTLQFLHRIDGYVCRAKSEFRRVVISRIFVCLDNVRKYYYCKKKMVIDVI